MKRYMIEEAKAGITNGGMACGPIFGFAVASVKYTDGEESKWLSMVEVEGIPNFNITDKDVYDILVEEDDNNEEFMELVNNPAGPSDGFDFGTDYYEFFEHIASVPDDPMNPVVKFLITLVRCSLGEEESIIKPAIGKYADELTFPEFEEEDEEYWA